MAILAARKCTPLDAAELWRILSSIDKAEDEKTRGELDKELHTQIGKDCRQSDDLQCACCSGSAD